MRAESPARAACATSGRAQQFAACERRRPVDFGAHIEIGSQQKPPADQGVEGALGSAAIAHARNSVKRLARNQWAEPLSRRAPHPPALARRLSNSPRNGARAGDDADTVALRGRPPPAHHVIATAMALDQQNLRGDAVRRGSSALFSPWAGKPDEGKPDLIDPQRGPPQRRIDARDQHGLQRVDARFEVIGGSRAVRCQRPPRLVDQQEVRFGTTAIDTKKGSHRDGFQG